MGGGEGGKGVWTSHTFYSQLPPLPVPFPLPPLCSFSIAKYYAIPRFFPVSSGSRLLGNPASRPLFSRTLLFVTSLHCLWFFTFFLQIQTGTSTARIQFFEELWKRTFSYIISQIYPGASERSGYSLSAIFNLPCLTEIFNPDFIRSNIHHSDRNS